MTFSRQRQNSIQNTCSLNVDYWLPRVWSGIFMIKLKYWKQRVIEVRRWGNPSTSTLLLQQAGNPLILMVHTVQVFQIILRHKTLKVLFLHLAILHTDYCLSVPLWDSHTDFSQVAAWSNPRFTQAPISSLWLVVMSCLFSNWKYLLKRLVDRILDWAISCDDWTIWISFFSLILDSLFFFTHSRSCFSSYSSSFIYRCRNSTVGLGVFQLCSFWLYYARIKIRSLTLTMLQNIGCT